MTETKQEKFDRMLVARLPKAVKAIELLGNLSRKSGYEWRGAQIDDMLDQLEGAVDGVMDAFGAGDEPAAPAEPGVVAAAQVQAGAVAGADRRDIREALLRLTKDHGPHDAGVKMLRKVVLGWVPQEDERTDEDIG